MSRILVWSPNYAPELTGIPPLVTDAAEWLAGHGHDVEVVTAVPNYPERVIRSEYRGALWRSERRGVVTVRRSWLRVRPEERFLDKALYELTFTACSLPNAVRAASRADVVLCVVPCVSAALAAAALARLRRNTRFVVWVQDLVLRAALSLDGLGAAPRRILTAARRAERAAFRSADRVVSCSPAFTSYLRELGVESGRIETIHNWVDLTRIRAEPQREPANGATRFLYTGNLGYTQGFETLVEAARLAGEAVEVEIVGAGNAAAHVRQLATGTSNVRVSDPVPNETYPALLASADVQVVLQRAVSTDANFPSKIPSYLASGRPIVASITPTSAAGETLEASGGALVVPAERPSELAAAMARLSGDAELRATLGRHGREFAERVFGREQALARFTRAVIGRP